MTVSYPALNPDTRSVFQPLTVKTMTIPNRIVMPPMGTNFATTTGELTDEHFAYYQERARGGTGLIIVENVCVDYPVASNGFTQLRLDSDRFLPRMFTFTEEMHRLGACVGIQINHAGASADPKKTGVPNISSSDVPSKDGMPVPIPMTKEDIKQAVKAYGETALRAKKAGFDMVEIHGGHSYLLDQFLSPRYNKRTDEYGGSPENRARIVTEVLQEVRKAVGEVFPVCIRLSADELIEGGNSLEDTLELASYFAEYVDIFNVSSALNYNLQYQIDMARLPDGWRSHMARAYKEKFGKPVITSGNIRAPEVAAKILDDGDADLLAMGRGLIADPWWVRKAREGREDEILRCISCNIGCADNRIRLGRPIRCTINPNILDNESYKEKKVKVPTRVLVVGGGVAGLEAASTAAEVGCRVTLLEKHDHLGGIISAATKLPAKWRIADYVEFAERRARRAGVEIRLGVEATVDMIGHENPDIVVNATGGTPALPPIPGVRELTDQEGTNVYSVLGFTENVERLDEEVVGKPVVVVGAGAVGLDIVEHLTDHGAQVTLVERLHRVGDELDIVTRLQMVEMLEKHNVEQLCSTSLLEVASDHAIVELPDGTQRTLQAAISVICLGMRPVRGDLDYLIERANRAERTVMNIGDSVQPRRIIDAVREGREILAVLERTGRR
ncbi:MULTISPECIES: FAD-dependent oxidoreductase [unclassified Actinobaculum]|uniref:oxidoreductase n=1 Tax=unclassified Actinobaculum TaxID=2609299 RepID=UPI000D527953|nr:MULTISPECIES: FAD-dependent oxidoreductase [unclassified Actinobaculum]AWE42896.1 2,4-dienoyl-CoA reductase [Actinobaculum sp. 313]RTE49018.1 FAD-dependent oxidoreductase [Actinobaculum sp. 352]